MLSYVRYHYGSVNSYYPINTMIETPGIVGHHLVTTIDEPPLMTILRLAKTTEELSTMTVLHLAISTVEPTLPLHSGPI